MLFIRYTFKIQHNYNTYSIIYIIQYIKYKTYIYNTIYLFYYELLFMIQ